MIDIYYAKWSQEEENKFFLEHKGSYRQFHDNRLYR